MKKLYKFFGTILATILSFVIMLGCFGGGQKELDIDPGDTIIDKNYDYNISFYGWGDLEEQSNFRALIAEFMKLNPNIYVSYTADASSDFMTNLIAAGTNLPDLFYMPDTDFLAFADSGKLANIANVVTQAEIDTIWADSINKYYYNSTTKMLGKSEGAKLFGLPKDLGPFTLVYNKTLFNQLAAQYGLTQEDKNLLSPTVPMTWEQFRGLLKKIDPNGLKGTRTYTDGNGQTAMHPYGISHYEVEAAVYSNNADFFDEEVKTSKIVEQNFVDAIQFIADLCLVDKTMPTAADQSSTDGYQMFKSSQSVFSFMGPWDNASFWTTTNFDYEVIPVPYGTADGARSVAWVGSMCYSISSNIKSESIPAAVALAKFLSMNEVAQRKFYELGQSIPNLKDMAINEYIPNSKGLLTGRAANPENRSVFVDVADGFKNASDLVGGKQRARYYTYSASWWNGEFQPMLKDVWDGKKTAQEALTAFNSTFQKRLTDMYWEYHED